VYKESDGMSINGHFEDEIWRSSWFHGRSNHSVVIGVDERLVQVEDENLPLNYCQSMPGDLRERGNIVLNSSVLLYHSDLFLEDISDEAPDF